MINFNDLIIKKYEPLLKKIFKKEYTEYWLSGGRSSTKSSFISLMIILLIVNNKDYNCLCLRKVSDTLRNSVFQQIIWAIDKLQLNSFFTVYKSILEIEYNITGQRILFKGLDDPLKLKSIKTSKGYFAIAWFEELSEFNGMEEIRNVEQSIRRGGEDFYYFYSYNPPINNNNWVNKEVLIKKNNRFHIHTTYKDVPTEWLGKEFLLEAEHLKKVNENAYRHEYLGEVIGTGLQIFNNLEITEITNKEIKEFDNIRIGIDFGYALHKEAVVKIHYDKTRKKIYIIDEIVGLGISNKELYNKMKEKGFLDNYIEIQADSAEPKSIRELMEMGLFIRGVKKGQGSIRYGIKFLQSMEKIVIDPQRTPTTYKQFLEYEYVKLKDGTIKEEYPDIEDDTIDAVRYSLNIDIPFTKN